MAVFTVLNSLGHGFSTEANGTSTRPGAPMLKRGLKATMLSRQHSGQDRSYACNDNGRLSAAWSDLNPAGTGILAVAGRGGCTVGLTHLADGVLIISVLAVRRKVLSGLRR
jgi:hypothetical protein